VDYLAPLTVLDGDLSIVLSPFSKPPSLPPPLPSINLSWARNSGIFSRARPSTGPERPWRGWRRRQPGICTKRREGGREGEKKEKAEEDRMKEKAQQGDMHPGEEKKRKFREGE